MPPALEDSIATASDMAPGSHTVTETETHGTLGSVKKIYTHQVKKNTEDIVSPPPMSTSSWLFLPISGNKTFTHPFNVRYVRRRRFRKIQLGNKRTKEQNITKTMKQSTLIRFKVWFGAWKTGDRMIAGKHLQRLCPRRF